MIRRNLAVGAAWLLLVTAWILAFHAAFTPCECAR